MFAHESLPPHQLVADPDYWQSGMRIAPLLSIVGELRTAISSNRRQDNIVNEISARHAWFEAADTYGREELTQGDEIPVYGEYEPYLVKVIVDKKTPSLPADRLRKSTEETLEKLINAYDQTAIEMETDPYYDQYSAKYYDPAQQVVYSREVGYFAGSHVKGYVEGVSSSQIGKPVDHNAPAIAIMPERIRVGSVYGYGKGRQAQLTKIAAATILYPS